MALPRSECYKSVGVVRYHWWGREEGMVENQVCIPNTEALECSTEEKGGG